MRLTKLSKNPFLIQKVPKSVPSTVIILTF